MVPKVLLVVFGYFMAFLNDKTHLYPPLRAKKGYKLYWYPKFYLLFFGYLPSLMTKLTYNHSLRAKNALNHSGTQSFLGTFKGFKLCWYPKFYLLFSGTPCLYWVTKLTYTHQLRAKNGLLIILVPKVLLVIILGTFPGFPEYKTHLHPPIRKKRSLNYAGTQSVICCFGYFGYFV